MTKRRLVLIVLLLAGTLIVAPQPSAAATALIVGHGSRSQPVVALTFDDGDSPVAVSAILQTLRSSRVPATFFPVASAMQQAPAVWRRVAAAGYPIGNHSVTHPELPKLSDARLRYEIEGATEIITATSGRPPIDVLRPPYGAWDARVASAAAAAGYSTLMLWDVDPRDWSGISAPTIVSRVLSHVRDGSVILLHAGPYHTPEALPAIIAGLRQRGYGFVTIPQLLGRVGQGVGGALGHPVSVSIPEPQLETVAPPARPTPAHRLGNPVVLLPAPEPKVDPRFLRF
ncbi:MAG TPA: polysaccharide deacetylase family protein [Candidatus Limnocylindria bacterium]|nr:polysaccharide deacetylase family protein [Candidatus Limnocylindria bacterium]